jgi:hypothetical protein
MRDERRLVGPAVVAAIVGGLVCCSRSKPRTVAPHSVPEYRIVPSPSLEFVRTERPSTECPHGSSTRSGRVAVAPHDHSSLSAVVSIEGVQQPALPPRFIDIPPRGDALVIERPADHYGAFDVRRSSGALVFNGHLHDGHVLARDEALYVSGVPTTWSGAIDQDAVEAYVGQSGELLASIVEGDEARMLTINLGLSGPDGPTEPDHMVEETVHLHGPNAATRSVWSYGVSEPGVGAIDARGETVLALESGHLVVLWPDGDAKTGRAIVALDAPIDRGATDLSVVPPFAMVLYGGGDAGPLVRRWSAGTSSSRLDARRADGSLAWRASLPFLATQPPLDGDHRVYVVGSGIVALDLEGHTLWTLAAAAPLRAATFSDGTLAVVGGDEVRIFGADGAVRRSFRAHEELTTYPAIASDGAVWIASAKTLYVVR